MLVLRKAIVKTRRRHCIGCWEMLTKASSDEGVLCTIKEDRLTFHSQKANNLIKKCAKDPDRHLNRKARQMRTRQRCSLHTQQGNTTFHDTAGEAVAPEKPEFVADSNATPCRHFGTLEDVSQTSTYSQTYRTAYQLCSFVFP